MVPAMPTLPTHMRYANLTQPGGPEVLQIAEGPLPILKEGEVLVAVEASGINRPDLLQRAGAYPPPAGASPVLGLEITGRVVKGAQGLKEGDRVMALTPGGAYAEFCAVPAGHCLPVPEALSTEEAAGFCETAFTVWANVFQIAKLHAGEKFLVHGGSSGIGTTAIQMAKAFGAEVFATAGTEEKCQACEALGAKAINYKQKNFAEEILALTHGEGVNVILDMVGGDYAQKNIDSLAKGGRLVMIATQRGKESTIDLSKVMQKRIVITGSTLRPRSMLEKEEIARGLREEVLPLVAQKKIRVLVDKVFPFGEIAAAHRYLEAGEHVGKVILKMK